MEKSKKEGILGVGAQRPSLPGQVDSKLLFGNSEKMTVIGKIIHQIADTDVSVLIVGESGTGKELVANAVHLKSLRKNTPLIKVNCVAIPGELLESELFGYEKGAFTGAYNSKPGRFEFAHKGTIFLDEIGDMPFPLQAKLLRVLQGGKFFRLGGKNEVEVDVRIIAATNKDLEYEMRRGTFREDLFYRLNVIKLRIPPLRERYQEIIPLIDFFLKKYSQAYNKTAPELTEDTLKLLINYRWPGNIRELENVIKRFVVLEDIEVVLREVNNKEDKTKKKDSIDKDSQDNEESYSLKEIGRKAAFQAEKIVIKKILQQTQWNRKRTAEILQVSYKTLLSKIKETGLDRAKERDTGY